MESVRRAGVSKDARILDVGCGSGRLLQDLAYLGFTNLTGADPFNERDLVYPSGVKVLKRQLGQMDGEFDLIMLHFSYEHLDNPNGIMQDIHRLLRPGGEAVIRIPIASSYAWQRYGVNWVNLDPPRHFFLHTFKSIDLIAEKTGLRVENVVHEGFDDQFWASEQFERDIPSQDPRSLYSSPLKRLLAWRTIRACKAKAEELNRKKQSDLVCFHLRKPNVGTKNQGQAIPPADSAGKPS